MSRFGIVMNASKNRYYQQFRRPARIADRPVYAVFDRDLKKSVFGHVPHWRANRWIDTAERGEFYEI